MSYTVTGTGGSDNLNQSADTGPGSIFGLDGNDIIRTGTGAATVEGGSGEDTVILRAGNTGQVTAGTENDSIWDQNQDIGSMILFGNEGADTINVNNSTNAQTILGGNDQADAADRILSGSGADLIFGNGGDDTINGGNGNDTMIGGFGNDTIHDPATGGNDLVFANEGNDTIDIYGGNDTVYAGQGNDTAVAQSGASVFYMGEGNDTFEGSANTSNLTVVGGNDAFDGADSIRTGSGADLVFGNGGNDTIRSNEGGDTVIGGVGNDSLQATGNATDLIFANEGDDTVQAASGDDTVYGGQGNDMVTGGATSGQLLMGGEGNDTVTGLLGIDTLIGGAGADVFYYLNDPDEDGDNAVAGGPIEQITDVNFDEDRFRVFNAVSYAANVGAVNGANLEASAEIAIQASLALGGGGAAQHVAAQFTFNGREYLAIDQGGLNNLFTDDFDLLVDITGATGTIGANDFFV